MRSLLVPEFRWPRLKALFGARAIQQAYANASWRKLDLLENALRQALRRGQRNSGTRSERIKQN